MLKKILKDERGLSLVELLAVVVIMAIIAGIGAVAITGVIQKNKEDAGISTVQNLMAAANMYQASNEGNENAIGTKSPKVNASDLVTANVITNIGGGVVEDSIPGIEFDMVDNKIVMTIPARTFLTGNMQNKAKSNINEGAVAKLDRAGFWEPKTSN
ncbi:type IV pilin protein [Candidatus Enterococcus ikei]|uniref:Prepilin-type N-terminal cleavage/methylation domain-containing protein n=1 Tax=Candidatus Enterococcus ikei TaxID=2815326 RepID=A0ABS3H012_9ENTE|nr:prepilin-type N-terminal cleavage/methylation domain-containing protein [Enterococcus sp. DIV0869a]MBO0440846.1 prepilin-type N-terminal cleavage/methylation domain-containing protein [Enterococcus sp. DIV0869a]